MEKIPSVSTWSALSARIQTAWTEIESIARTPSPPTHIRYIAIAWIPTATAKGRTHRHATSDRPTSGRTIVALQTAEWDLDARALFWAHAASVGDAAASGGATAELDPRQTNIRARLVDLVLKHTFDREEDSMHPACGRPWEFCWTLRPRGVQGVGSGRRQRSGVDAALRRVGLVPADELPRVDLKMFRTDLVAEEAMPRFVVYAGRREAVKKGWGLQRNREIVHRETEMVN
ncbi:hypothetical protein BDK51DRAFT_26661 [Blyttiomyces helicus]|uniref:Uncharacterized protein n=1 Tax=Blyttiomyces helicus TaxID=388810 RepID=A0A4P9W6Y6_9FUNG|nr:hypothetical protein BDK51DRAFT_26661 [Blyttiomyces helicus]|eukprot:RKO87153.1 hypothetical protein BDK51DRAFT_26661 [Blyttiomyces helicus]